MDLDSETIMNSEDGDNRPGDHEKKLNECKKWLNTPNLFTLLFLVPPSSLSLQGASSQRKKLSAPRISLSLDQSEDDLGETPDDLDINVDDLDTPDEGDYLDYTDHELDWEGKKENPLLEKPADVNLLNGWLSLNTRAQRG